MSKSSDSESSSDDEGPKQRKPDKIAQKASKGGVRQTCIIPDTLQPILATIAGPIEPWLPCPENLPNHPTMAFFGKRRTGKSTSITNILFHCCLDYPFGIVMSDTAYAGYWQKLVPERQIVQGLRQDVLDWVINRQKKLVAKYGVKDPRIKMFIVLDDVVSYSCTSYKTQ